MPLTQIYLEDSLSDRIWVDLDECKAFVLNLETALPPVTGDPRGLFTLLCASGPPVAGVQAALGLNLPSAASIAAPLLPPATSLDLADAVATALHATRTSQSAKVTSVQFNIRESFADATITVAIILSLLT